MTSWKQFLRSHYPNFESSRSAHLDRGFFARERGIRKMQRTAVFAFLFKSYGGNGFRQYGTQI